MANVTIRDLDRAVEIGDDDLLELEQDSSKSVSVGQLKDKINAETELALEGKVDKVEGKQLSTEDFTTEDKNKLEGLENYDDTEISGRITVVEDSLEQKVDKVEGKQLSDQNFTLAEKNKLGDLSNYDDTGISNRIGDVEIELDSKVDKVEGKQLSDQNFTLAEKNKLADLQNYDDSGITAALDQKVDKVAGKQLSDQNFTLAEKNKLSTLENYDDSGVMDSLDQKVDKVVGKELSSNDFTDELRDKLASLEGSHFRGTFSSLTALSSAIPEAEAGDYADVDAPDVDAERYIWDSSDSIWVLSTSRATPLTAAQIKQLYESNPDTNPFDDAAESKLEGIAEEATKNQTDAYLLNRANHTGTQGISTISGLEAELGGKVGNDDPRLSDSREWSAPTMTQGEAEAGTATNRRAVTAQVLRQAITALGLKIGTTSDTAAAGDDPRLSDSRDWNASEIGQTEAEEGTSTTARKWTSQRVRQSVIAFFNGITTVWSRGFLSSADSAAGRGVLEITDADLLSKSVSLGTTHLDTVLEPGNYHQNSASNATMERGYPSVSGVGQLKVSYINTTVVLQEYVVGTSVQVKYTRRLVSGVPTVWRQTLYVGEGGWMGLPPNTTMSGYDESVVVGTIRSGSGVSNPFGVFGATLVLPYASNFVMQMHTGFGANQSLRVRWLNDGVWSSPVTMLSSADVVSSSSDTTAGKILNVGAGGLLGGSPLYTAEESEGVINNQFFRIAQNSLYGSSGTGISLRYNAENTSHIFVCNATNEIKLRQKVAGVWQEPVSSLTTLNGVTKQEFNDTIGDINAALLSIIGEEI